MGSWWFVGEGGSIFWLGGVGWTFSMGGWGWEGVGGGIFWVGGGWMGMSGGGHPF